MTNKNSFLTRVTKKSLVMLIFTLVSHVLMAQDETQVSAENAAIVEQGAALFKGNCKTCHKVHEKLVGPALAGIQQRAPSTEWIINFVKNSAKVIATGDEYAVALYEEYNKTQMTAFPTFTEDQIMSILAYIESEANKEPVSEVVQTDTNASNQSLGLDETSAFYLKVIVVGLVIVLLLLLVVFIIISSILKKLLNQSNDLDEDDKRIVNPKFDFNKLFKSTPFVFMVTFLFTSIAFKVVINNLYAVGVQKGYSPKQPIAFSHKLHAGQYEIDCNYCHTGVYKSKSANIPSPNICMNCHSAIKTESPEIQKIYAAVENDEPIEWIRVHNLPDLAYFNHSQHVSVGGIDCETCHGEIKEMEVVEQASLLTMGWCIDCHRNTEVNTKNNQYYSKLVELHEAESSDALKVEDIGGLECSKCHY